MREEQERGSSIFNVVTVHLAECVGEMHEVAYGA